MESQCQTNSPISNLIHTEGPHYDGVTGASIAIFVVSHTLRHLCAIRNPRGTSASFAH